MGAGDHLFGRPLQQHDLASRLEILNGLFSTLTDVLDIREVFDRVSQVVQRVLPHDLMGVMEISEAGDRIRLHAGAGSGKATPPYEVAVPDPQILARPWDAMIVEDFANHPLAKGSPAVKAGMVTVLSAPIRFGGRLQAAVKKLLGRNDVGTGRFFKNQTYHHAVLRALNEVATHGADISEILQATTKMRAGDEQNWFAEWTALGDRSMARARSVRNRQSRGEALLRAHTYYARAQFYLPWNDQKRPATFDLTRKVFYEGLDTLGVAYEKIDVPYGANQLKAVYYPAPKPVNGPLIVFCGGYDTIVEELYFFLAASACSRGYSVLTFDGPGQGAPLREQGQQFTPEWEKPTAAVLDAFLATYTRPEKIVLIGLSMGGYLAPRAAAFESRIDGVVSYDIGYDIQAAFMAGVPRSLLRLRRIGLGKLVDKLAAFAARFNPNLKWALSNSRWTMGASGLLEMLDAVGPYTLAGVADRIRQDVLILAGAEDQFIPLNQVEKYKRALVNARSITTKVYDRASGGQEHSQLGTPTLWQADFFDWIEEKFGTRQSPNFEMAVTGTRH